MRTSSFSYFLLIVSAIILPQGTTLLLAPTPQPTFDIAASQFLKGLLMGMQNDTQSSAYTTCALSVEPLITQFGSTIQGVLVAYTASGLLDLA